MCEITNFLAAFVERSESLHALGPSLSMKNTTGLLGTVEDGQLELDWGVNAAVLFGRQKTKTSHHSTIQLLEGWIRYNQCPHACRTFALANGHHSEYRWICGAFLSLLQRENQCRISRGFLFRCEGRRVGHAQYNRHRLSRPVCHPKHRTGGIGFGCDCDLRDEPM